MSIIQGTSKAAGGAGYEIDQSIRFNKTDNSGLTVTPSAGNRDLFTLSVWFKLGLVTSTEYRTLFCADTSNTFQITFLPTANGDYLRFQDNGVRIFDFSQSLRDPSAWYHLVYAYDSAQATAADRCKAYLNGEEVTDLTGVAYPAQNVDSKWNSAVVHGIGYRSATDNWDGYLSEINHIEGAALDPTSFGETNADTGQWVPIAYTGSYGTNGFYITGADSADLGADDSGNGNNFTSSGLTAADQVSDSPTDNFCTMSSINTYSGLTLADGNLKVSAGAQALNKVNGTFWVDADQGGAWYFEYTVGSSNDQLPGWTGSERTDKYPGQGTDSYSYAWARNGGAAYNPAGSTSAHTGSGTYVSGDVLGWLIDFDNNEVKVGKVSSGTWSATITWTDLGTYKDGGPAGGAWTATDRPYNGNGTFNFGQTGGFAASNAPGQALKTSNLSDPTIADPSAYFQTTTYAGTGSTRSVDQSGNSTFEPGFVWIKARDAAYDHALYDQVRGATEELKSNASSAESTISTGLTAFESDGFQVGSRLGVNDGTKNFVAWQWKAAGSGSSNTDGSITSTVSANTTSGFSIVSYTGTGANATVGHGLGVAPSMVICKQRNASRSWVVYHEGLTSAANVIYLDLTSAQATDSTVWNSTDPTSTVFSVGSANGSNSSGNGMIAYCFAEVEGFSKFGSFTGNGSSTDGPFIYTGFTPEFFMWKRTDSGTYGDWTMMDTKRDPFNMAERNMRANSAIADDTGEANLDFVSNGIKHRGGTSARFNQSGATYIYMAFAESPFKTATAR